mgnify:CR=1 FL=1
MQLSISAQIKKGSEEQKNDLRSKLQKIEEDEKRVIASAESIKLQKIEANEKRVIASAKSILSR